jgi:hypothetical protein
MELLRNACQEGPGIPSVAHRLRHCLASLEHILDHNRDQSGDALQGFDLGSREMGEAGELGAKPDPLAVLLGEHDPV